MTFGEIKFLSRAITTTGGPFFQEKGFERIKILNNNAYLADGISVCGTRGWINDDSAPFDAKLLNREAGRLEMSVIEGEKLGDEVVAFLHYPPIFGAEKNYYMLDVMKKHGITRCYYGHVHGAAIKKAFNGEHDGIAFQITSCDCVNFTPVRVE